MAPEVIQARHYDSSADIWSFGITALELTQGRPPRSRESPQRVLLKTYAQMGARSVLIHSRRIQEAPPTLDREGGTYKYSRAFKEMVDSCLVKDPSKR
jgi:serine/threonine-protein kinase OSR1/STK39